MKQINKQYTRHYFLIISELLKITKALLLDNLIIMQNNKNIFKPIE